MSSDVDTRDTGLGLHVVDLPTAKLGPGSSVQFTFLWHDSGAWEGRDYEVSVTD